MTDLLSIGASGLRAYRDALGTTSDNIANAQTAGYVRRTLQLEEATTGGNSPLYRASVSPGGVLVGGVQRAVDQWLVEDSRASISNAARASERLSWLNAGERALNEGSYGVGAAATNLFNAADTLAADPTNGASRLAFIQSVAVAVETFRNTAEQLRSVSTGIANAASIGVNQVNADLAALQKVNEGLLRSREGSTSQAALLDDRDRLLDSLAGSLPVSVSYDAKGAASVSVAGAGGAVLLAGPQREAVSLTVASDGRLSFAVGTIPMQASSGKFAGLVSAAENTADQRAALDQLAGQFANELNAAHQSGVDANGNAGRPLVDFAGSAITLTALALTPAQVAAADSVRDNGNMLGFSNLRGLGGIEQGWAQLAAAQAQTVSSARAEDAAAAARRDGALQARSELSAVDLDHEAAELLRFQQAYEASARVIQTARETFQSILSAL